MNKIIVVAFLVAIDLGHQALSQYNKDSGCFEKWLEGYRLAMGRPQRTLTSVSLERCQTECERERGCGALAYGVAGTANGTCELAIRTLRDSRSVSNETLTYNEIAKAPHYDIYVMGPLCTQRQPLYTSGAFGDGSRGSSYASGNGVPIDCFYRLMSGKRLAKNHVFRSISVSGLQECQEACIEDPNDCRSISYRYMMSGSYASNVANCELSPFHIAHYEDNNRAKFDFVDDYDYDYFQREPHCKTTSRLVGSFGVCAVVSRKGAKLSQRLIRSTHQTSTATQCEFLCQTASRFRCRAFALRHTTRGSHPFHRDTSYESSCTLYDVDPGQMSQYIENDPDYDLYELGRLMGGECVLQEQYLNRRPTQAGYTHTRDYEDHRRERYPLPSDFDRDRNRYYERDFNRDYDRDRNRDYERDRNRVYERDRNREYERDRTRDHERDYRPTSYLPQRPYDYDYHSKRPGSYYLPEQKLVGDGSFPKPGSSSDGDTIRGSVTHGIGTSSFLRQPTSPRPNPNLPYYDPRREACLVKIKQDVYLAPEATRAQFPVKSIDECRIECIRSLEVFRFPCRVMSFRLTSSSGGTCQLSEIYERDIRGNDFVPARDRYENAVVYSYDDNDVMCRRDEGRGRYPPPQQGGNRYDYNDRENIYRYRPPGGTGSGTGSVTVVEHYGRRPYVDYRPRYPNENDHQYRERDRYGSSYNYGGDNRYIPPPTHEVQTYTVNGEKCLRQCSQDREAGFYYCVVDTRGTWDFCCRPDHYCGYSRGLSTPWCYVGSGPTSQVWRSCNHRLLSESPNPPLAYLHDRQPPKVHSLTTSEVANLSKDNALKLIKSSTTVTGVPDKSEFANIDDDDDGRIATPLLVPSELQASSNGSEVFYLGPIPKNESVSGKSLSRHGRKAGKNPKFTLVDIESKDSKTGE